MGKRVGTIAIRAKTRLDLKQSFFRMRPASHIIRERIKVPSRFSKTVRKSARFAKDRRGNTALIFGLSFVPIMMIAGAAVDYTVASQKKTALQATLDAGVLAAAIQNSASTTAAAATVSSFVVAKFTTTSGDVPKLTTTYDNGVVTSSAEAPFKTNFMKLFGVSSLNITAYSQAGNGTGKAEVVLVLDTTGSMLGAKLAGVQLAAANLVDTVMASPAASTRIRFALAPFATYVNVGVQYSSASWISDTAPRVSTSPASCRDTYPNAVYGPSSTTSATCYNDGTPYSCTQTSSPLISQGAPVNVCYPASTSTQVWGGCVGSRNYPLDTQEGFDSSNPARGVFNSCGTPIVRLTNDSSVIKAQIGMFSANAETYIAPGLLWGWNLLSPMSPFADGAAYGASTRKVVVLMTDGANTRSPTYPEHDGTDPSLGDTRLTQICSGMKAKNIEIFTIAFDVSDVSIKNRLSECATDAGHYFAAGTISAMQAAFGQIAVSLNGVRLMK